MSRSFTNLDSFYRYKLCDNSERILSNVEVSITVNLQNVVESNPNQTYGFLEFDTIVAFGYTNISADDYTVYVGAPNEIFSVTRSVEQFSFTSYNTTLVNVAVNSKIVFAVVTMELISPPNETTQTHVKFTLWRAVFCPVLVNSIANSVTLKYHRTVLMRIDEELAPDTSSDITPAQLMYAKSILLQYLNNANSANV